MKKIITFIAAFITSSCSILFGGDYEQPNYKVIKKSGNIEIRQYEKYIVAETFVEGDRKTAPNKAFKVLAAYIFGKNEEAKEISMTVPVTMVERKMNFWSMNFMMPAQYKISDLPTPNSDKISFREVEKRKIAAIIFDGRWTEKNFNKQTQELLAYLKENNYKINSQEINAFYDDPFTLPWNRRNEIMFEIN